MIDQISVFSHGGVVLWDKQYEKVPQDVLNALVSKVFIEEDRIAVTGGSGYVIGKYTAQFSYDNDLGICAALVYQSVLRLGFAKDFINDVKKVFANMYTADDVSQDRLPDLAKFEAMVELRLKKLEEEGRKEQNGASSVTADVPVSVNTPDLASQDSAKATPETTVSSYNSTLGQVDGRCHVEITNCRMTRERVLFASPGEGVKAQRRKIPVLTLPPRTRKRCDDGATMEPPSLTAMEKLDRWISAAALVTRPRQGQLELERGWMTRLLSDMVQRAVAESLY
jgi:hypothetical protein